VPNAQRGKNSDAVANARGKLIDERKRIGASHALRAEDSAACKIFHTRVNPNVRTVLVDAAGDDGAGAGMLRHLGGLVELQCFEIRCALLPCGLNQALRADEIQPVGLREAG
jgi:hypothetical protein